MKKNIISMAAAMAVLSACGPGVPQLGKSSLDEVIGAMTLEEKAHLVVGTGMAGFSGDSAVIGATRKLVPGAAGTTYPIERLGIPAVVLADGPAGLRIDPKREGDSATYYCTHFPIGTLLASTWDQELVESVGQSIGNEVLEYGADVLLAPALNIHRNPLCGRNFEYYSEDPLVSGKIAAAYVRGVQSNGVGTSIKHFAVNNQETNRMATDAHVSPRALREIYLKGFEIAVKESAPWTVMSSYNYLNGVYTSENKELQTTMLRDEWGFKGMVMTDWFGGKDAVAQMVAGNDMLQPGLPKQYEAIVKGVQDGALDEAILNQNVKRILEMILQTPRFKGYEYSNKPDLKAHAAVTRQSATEGMVLLKNDNGALPLAADVKNVALFGCTSYDFIAGGTGSGNVNRAYTVSLLDGLKNAGYVVDEALKNSYEAYLKAEKERLSKDKKEWFMPDTRPAEMAVSAQVIREQAAKADVALVTLGRTSGEFLDRMVADFNLTKEEQNMLKAVSDAFHAAGKKVVVVLNIGGVIETASWKSAPDAILCAWQAGQEGGNSVADVLSGKASPSGKLTMTFPVKFEDAASSDNFPIDMRVSTDLMNKGGKKNDVKNVDYTNYEEDIYVGYRYFDTFGKQVSYPFGYGLSYTTFAYDKAAVKADNGAYTVSVEVKNTGKVAGKEVVQLYVSAPDAATANKPEKELKAFAKTKELKPGEAVVVTLKVNADDLASYDEAASAWVVTPGNYKFLVGASSRDIKATLEAEVAAATQKTNNILKLQEPMSLLKR
ncbi:glycoside hydrolase family 3 C-terminal domain-containing protein [Bacteroides uniformis]|uniref:glycoside hydrolase family 3 C-terminal domain-containing protein n=1 Tax=Bacteroides uniformis TaxID=820 RepID=UPI00202F814A|nr:glycoside hydrolase family 3 C-terminal domain-containing protein [Bacteroides uniformis]MCM1629166.1 glycoside hydrolase family 3 C-terminal domain-containing protein [Bacteroides uniformis]MCM1631977.1 glycoside hydrolase family 3 C-terminal domain-containing protein [Bacteroides uniformis]MCM1666673.1 glycoside hydrolase family 3 C-terminal domain-containing protein [Bacteroides uniformis]MCM1702970.1 glycoside hydrolase family 3 C-terminal domain-containing protein [Bacteroides uniformis